MFRKGLEMFRFPIMKSDYDMYKKSEYPQMSIELSFIWREQTSTFGQWKNNFIWLCILVILNNVTF